MTIKWKPASAEELQRRKMAGVNPVSKSTSKSTSAKKGK